MTVRTGGPAQDVYIVGGDASGGGAPTTIAGPLGPGAASGGVRTAWSTEDVALLSPSATLYAGTLATSTSAAALAASQAVREVIVQNDPDSTTDVLVGSASAQTIQLKPGWSITIPVANLATVFAKSVSGTPVVNYLGRS